MRNIHLEGACGLDCSVCPAFLARKNNDQKLRDKTAEEWRKAYNAPHIQAENIDCTGCRGDENYLFQHCLVCRIRQCADKRELMDCSLCCDYPCDILKDLTDHVPEATARLENNRLSCQLELDWDAFIKELRFFFDKKKEWVFSTGVEG